MTAANDEPLQTENETYTVSKLPAFPDRLRTDVKGIGSDQTQK